MRIAGFATAKLDAASVAGINSTGLQTPKTILAFIGGSDRDEVILQTALAVALPLSARLDFLHAHVPSTLAAQHARLEFAPAGVICDTLARLEGDAHTYSSVAAEHVRTFCAKSGIPLCDGPTESSGVTARFFEEATNDLHRLAFHAAQRDLVVIGRARQKQGLAPDTLEHLVRTSGRPILAAGRAAPRSLTGTIMVCWKGDGSTAAAVRDAGPLLAKAQRVVFVSVAKRDTALSTAMGAAAREVGRTEAETRVIPPSAGGIPDALAVAADECEADLLVLGAYGCSRGRQILFGSCTDRVLAVPSDLSC